MNARATAGRGRDILDRIDVGTSRASPEDDEQCSEHCGARAATRGRQRELCDLTHRSALPFRLSHGDLDSFSIIHIPVDHLVYATPDLERGMREIKQLTGIAPVLGGGIPARDTQCPGCPWLRLVSRDCRSGVDQPSPAGGRWLGVHASTSSRLTTRPLFC